MDKRRQFAEIRCGATKKGRPCGAFLGLHEVTRPNLSYHYCRDCNQTREAETEIGELGAVKERTIKKGERIFTPETVLRIDGSHS